MVGAGGLVWGVLGPARASIVEPLRLRAVGGLLRSLTRLGAALFNALGRPELNSALNVLRLAVFVPLLLFLIRSHGIEGAAAAVTLSLLACIPTCLYGVRKILGIGISEHILAVAGRTGKR